MLSTLDLIVPRGTSKKTYSGRQSAHPFISIYFFILLNRVLFLRL